MKLQENCREIGNWTCRISVLATDSDGNARRVQVNPMLLHEGQGVLLEFVIMPWEDDCKIYNTWLKNGMLKKKVGSLIFQKTYLTDGQGQQKEGYCPQLKRAGNRVVYDFDYLLEGTEENLEKLIKVTLENL